MIKISNFKLVEDSESLDEIIIIEDVEKLNIRKPQMSLNSLSINTIKQIPVVLGEVDLIKSAIFDNSCKVSSLLGSLRSVSCCLVKLNSYTTRLVS